MKFFTALLALAITALAAPHNPNNNANDISARSDGGETCTFGTYRCTTPNTGIEICNISNKWELVGDCPKGTECTNLQQNGYELPFCTTKAKTIDSRDSGHHGGSGGWWPGSWCPTPGRYDCLGWGAIQVCDVTHISRFVGTCPAGSHCAYLNGIPYCVAN